MERTFIIEGAFNWNKYGTSFLKIFVVFSYFLISFLSFVVVLVLNFLHDRFVVYLSVCFV